MLHQPRSIAEVPVCLDDVGAGYVKAAFAMIDGKGFVGEDEADGLVFPNTEKACTLRGTSEQTLSQLFRRGMRLMSIVLREPVTKVAKPFKVELPCLRRLE